MRNSFSEQLSKIIIPARLGLALCVALFTTTAAFARTIDLSTEPPSEDGTILVNNGDVLTGELDGSTRPYKVVVASGATVTLNNAAVNGVVNNDDYTWAGISCLGNCNILLAEGSKNYVHGFNKAPGIFVPQKATLTIDGDGELEAVGDWSGAGIGGGMIGDLRESGSIVINGGTITATSEYAAGIGCGPAGSSEASCEDIVINGGNITAKSLLYGAGIGGGYGSSCGNITITGGTIETFCGYVGAGIGTGASGKVGNILITGGTVTATGDNYAVGIGSPSGTCGNITIGENVTQVTAITNGEANRYSVGGYSGNVGVITIGGVVTGSISSSPFVYPQKTYTVVFDKNEGSGEMANQTAYYDSELPLSLNTYTREGYLFAGWNTQPDGSGDVYTDGAKVQNLANAGESVTLYAQWFNGDVSMLKVDIVVENGMVLKGKLSSNISISIAADAEVTFDGLTIEGVDDENFKWAGITCYDNCKINLAEGSKNVVKGFDYRFPGIFFNTRSTLTIDGNGSLEASSNGLGAGIGAASVSWGDCGNVVIKGGNITATGGRYAAGIGGSRESNCGNIEIKGGNIAATSGGYAAGIGGGYKASCGNIEIKGGVIIAEGDWGGAGIGGGSNGTCGNVVIEGGNITATGGDYAAGIGGSFNGNCGNIDIKGGTTIVSGGYLGPALGCDENSSCGYVAISGEKTRVTATKGKNSMYNIGLSENYSAGITGVEGLVEGSIKTSPYVYPPLLAITDDENGKHASINGAYGGLDVLDFAEDIDNVDVAFNREFAAGVFSTLTLPFDVSTEYLEGLGMLLKFNGLKQKDVNGKKQWVVRMKKLWEKGVTAEYKTLEAYTPYMVLMDDASLKVNTAVTLKKSKESVATVEGSEWEFRGTLAYKQWGGKNDKEIGRVYGFAAEANDNIAVGQFVKAGEGAYIYPLRAYLLAPQTTATGIKSNIAGGKNFSTMSLPEIIDVEMEEVGESGNEPKTTVIGKFDTRTGEFTSVKNGAAARTFDAKGRNVGSKVGKARGAYYGKGGKAAVAR